MSTSRRPLERRATNAAIVLLGLWEAGDILAFITPGFGTVPIAVVNHIVVGIVLMVVGTAAALLSSVTVARRLDWIAAAAGAWLVAATFLLRRDPLGAAAWNDLAVGAVVVILAGWTSRVARA